MYWIVIFKELFLKRFHKNRGSNHAAFWQFQPLNSFSLLSFYLTRWSVCRFWDVQYSSCATINRHSLLGYKPNPFYSCKQFIIIYTKRSSLDLIFESNFWLAILQQVVSHSTACKMCYVAKWVKTLRCINDSSWATGIFYDCRTRPITISVEPHRRI